MKAKYNFYELQGIIDIFQKVRNKAKKSSYQDSCDHLIKIISDFIAMGEKHPYFELLEPELYELASYSQARSISIREDNKEPLSNNIANYGGVKVPLIVEKYPCSSNTGKKGAILDGVTRHSAVLELKENKVLPQDYKYPCLAIPPSEIPKIKAAIVTLQHAANQPDPKAANNSNDLGKFLVSHMESHKLDLEKESDVKELTDLASIIYINLKPSTIKSRVTQLRNKVKQQLSDVFITDTKKFVKKSEDFFKPRKLEKRTFVSLKGNLFVQRFGIEAVHKYDNPSDHFVWVFADQEGKGSSQTTINSRIGFFEKLYKTWYELGNGVLPETILIAPQNTSSFTARIDDDEVTTESEHFENKKHWIVVNKNEILKVFQQKKSGKTALFYKKDWICRQKRCAKVLPIKKEA